MRISVLIPTISGRESFLHQTVSGYLAHTPGFDLEFIILRDRPTCGIGWQEAAEEASGHFLHFSNDDIYPWDGWAEPLVETAEAGHIAAPWISHGPWGQFYASPEGQVLVDRQEVDHSAMPFMLGSRFRVIQPICAVHYGVDNWIAWRARQLGIKIIGRTPSVICHFASEVGRQDGDWTEQDLLDYDCNIAIPEYQDGLRPPDALPPDRLTPEGLRRARQWRKENVR